MENELKMSESLFNMIFQLVRQGDLDSIRFVPYHKGTDIYINGKLNKNKEKELKSQIEHWYYENFDIGFEICPFFDKQILKANITETINWGFLGGNQININLLTPSEIAAFLMVQEEKIDMNNLEVQFSARVSHAGIDVEEYSLEYSRGKATITLAKNEKLKKVLMERVQEACHDARYFKSDQFECFVSGASLESITISSESGETRTVVLVPDKSL